MVAPSARAKVTRRTRVGPASPAGTLNSLVISELFTQCIGSWVVRPERQDRMPAGTFRI